MEILNKKYPLSGRRHTAFILLTTAWILVALFEFTQDLVSVSLNGSRLQLMDSLVFKVFWLLFIPANLVLFWCLKTWDIRLQRFEDYVKSILIILIISTVHLVLFSLLLNAYSGIVHTDPWSIGELIIKKLTSRLYIVLAVNTLITGYYLWSVPGEKTVKQYKNVIPVKSGKKSRMVRTCDIHWIGSDQGYAAIHTDDRQYLLSSSLKELVTELDPHRFKRVHKSTIVNMDQVQELKSRLNGDYDIILENGTQLRLSRNYAKALKGTWL